MKNQRQKLKGKYVIPDDDNEVNDFSFKLGQQNYTKRPDDFYPIYSYKYLNIKEIEDYCFIQSNFSTDEYNKYFEIVKQLSQSTIGDLHQRGEFRFRISKHNARLLDLLKRLIGKAYLSDEQIPEFGHFHLTTEEKDGKKPVIHFFIGEKGVFHMLFYDPFHNIHPTKP